MSPLDLAAVLLVLAATLAYLNVRFFRLPATIAMLVAGLLGAMALLAFDAVVPSLHIGSGAARLIQDVDFSRLLMRGMLGFLLFAGALTVDGGELRRSLDTVLSLATAGVLLSTAIIGLGSYLLFPIAGVRVPLLNCFVFGALISPTDPVAVVALMDELHVPKSMQIYFTGESLLNDGVGVVIFTIFLALATAPSSGLTLTEVAALFGREVIGGSLLGLAGGYLVYFAAKQIDEPNIEVQLSVALVMALVVLSWHLHVSGPLACVIAGIFIGNQGRQYAMRDATKEALDRIWSFADHIMNTALFLLLGLQAALFDVQSWRHAAMIASIVILVVGARLVSVAIPVTVLRAAREFPQGMVRMLTWGGLRGGISVALALSLPPIAGRAAILNVTYMIVIFTIVVQGLTIGRLMRSFTAGVAAAPTGD